VIETRNEEMNRKMKNVETHEGRRVGGVVSVRLKPDEFEVLEALAESSGRSLSETLRAALHHFARTPDLPGVGRPGEVVGFTRGGESREPEPAPTA
jgi:hypothetical protein